MKLDRLVPVILSFVIAVDAGSALAQPPDSQQLRERPNFVWLISEDNSKHHLKLFDEHGAESGGGGRSPRA